MDEQPKGTRPNEIFQKYNSHHDSRGRFASGGGAGGGAAAGGGAPGGGGYAKIMERSVADIASKHLAVDSLQETRSSQDFKEVGVVGVGRALQAAYKSGQLAAYVTDRRAKGVPQNTKEIDPKFAEDLAVTHFNRPRENPLKEQRSDREDFKETSVTSIKDGLRAAFDAGYLHVQRSVATPKGRMELKATARKELQDKPRAPKKTRRGFGWG